MALRGDVQGGSAGGALGGPLPSVGFPTPADKNIAIEQYCRWRWAFFGGALLVFSVALGSAIYWMSPKNVTFAPPTFIFEVFFLMFGFFMLVLDTPVPNMQNHPWIVGVRLHIYKFALFMTRFIGRGAWYLFLATLVFGALYDLKVNKPLGVLCTVYLTVLGVMAMGKGLIMTHKLQRVRECITRAGYAAERYMSSRQTGLTVEQFKLMVESATSEHDLFTPEELNYVMSALSFQPVSDGQVTLEELKYWLMDGPPLMV